MNGIARHGADPICLPSLSRNDAVRLGQGTEADDAYRVA